MDNFRAIRERVRVDVMAVVKEDAYGHGAAPVARALATLEPRMFGVAIVCEAVELRDAGVTAPILVFGCLLPQAIDAILEYELTVQISDMAFARELARRSVSAGKATPVHLKVDTGMGRGGLWEEEAAEAALALADMPGVDLQGLMTHFPSSDDPEEAEFTRGQIGRFRAFSRRVESRGVRVRYRHTANSGACLGFPESWLDLVRPGISLYGCYPSPGAERTIPLRQAMTLRTRIALLKKAPTGRAISYGRTYTAPRDMRVAILPVGYGDGFDRRFSNCGRALVRGEEVSVVGRVCMDQCLIDVTDLPRVEVGDEVVLYGRQGDRSILIEDCAAGIGSIPNVLVCAVSKRVPRVYINAPDDDRPPLAHSSP